MVQTQSWFLAVLPTLPILLVYLAGVVVSINAIRVSSKILGSVWPIISNPIDALSSTRKANRCARLRIGAATRTTDPDFSFTTLLSRS